MVNKTFCLAIYILGSQIVYADHIWPRPIFYRMFLLVCDFFHAQVRARISMWGRVRPSDNPQPLFHKSKSKNFLK